MSQKKILVVDDDPAARVILEIYLQSDGFQVCFAEDGISCMAAARRERPDLILLDLGLPAGDGITVLKRMRGIDELSGIPVIVVSARDPEEWERVAQRASAAAYLEKPVERNELLAAVRGCLRGGGSAGEPAARSRDAIVVRVDGALAALVPDFLRRRRSDCECLTGALEAADYDSIASLGHRMKGNGAALGFDDVTAIGEALERAAGLRNRDEIRTQIDRLRDYLSRVEVLQEEVT